MTDDRQELARERLRAAIKAAGGAVRVAELANMPQTHLSTVATGKRPMGKETASKLRPLIDLPAEEWVELLAPSAAEPAPEVA